MHSLNHALTAQQRSDRENIVIYRSWPIRIAGFPARDAPNDISTHHLLSTKEKTWSSSSHFEKKTTPGYHQPIPVEGQFNNIDTFIGKNNSRARPASFHAHVHWRGFSWPVVKGSGRISIYNGIIIIISLISLFILSYTECQASDSICRLRQGDVERLHGDRVSCKVWFVIKNMIIINLTNVYFIFYISASSDPMFMPIQNRLR